MKPVFITGNQDKAAYLARHLGVELEHQKVELDEIQSTSLEEIVEHKVRQAYSRIGKPVLVEDVGLGFDSLGGLPGPFIKFFVDAPDGLEKLCRMCDGLATRNAKAACVYGYYDGKAVRLFRGELTGEIAEHPRGDGGFGWDKIFCPDGYGGKTRGELSVEQDAKTYATIKPYDALREFLRALPAKSEEALVTARCAWAKNELAIRYHDEEWGMPIHDDRKLFELLTLEGAQAGLSWDTVLAKRENYRQAFDGFDPHVVAQYDDAKRAELLQNPGIIRNRLKIVSATKNAVAFLKVQEEFGSFDAYLWGFVDGTPIQNHLRSMDDYHATTELSDTIAKDLKKRGFTFVGSTIIYAYLQSAGLVNDHIVSCFRYGELI